MRVFITTADIQILTGKSLRQAQRDLQAVRTSLNKKDNAPVSFDEYCDNTDMSPDVVKSVVTDARFIRTSKATKAA